MVEPDRKTAVKKKTEPQSEGRRLKGWRCRVISGEETGVEAMIGTVPLMLGASSSCDITLTDATVSRKHAQISLVKDGIQIRDMGSTNGIFYRSSKVESITITSDARIQLGNSEIEIALPKTPPIPASTRFRFGGLIGQSLPMRQIFSVLERAGPTDVTILIEGASGTGKEVAARGIHDHSPRADKPFVVVDCCASTEHLIESHLFGHRAGSFTGATSDRKGAFQEANGGTIFLDELGELPLASQGKLLRALEAQTVQPVGSDRPIQVNVRVIAATNRDLEQMVRERRFRFDLYHRLAVVNIRMPSLVDHVEDIPLLIRHFYEGRGVDSGEISGENLTPLMQYDWPGNVRELRNVLERAWVLSGPNGARFQNLPLLIGGATTEIPPNAIDTTLQFKEAKERWIDYYEKRYISAIFAEHGGNISQAAGHAGINRNHFKKLLIKHEILC